MSLGETGGVILSARGLHFNTIELLWEMYTKESIKVLDGTREAQKCCSLGQGRRLNLRRGGLDASPNF